MATLTGTDVSERGQQGLHWARVRGVASQFRGWTMTVAAALGPRLRAGRTALLAVGGFGFLSAAAWTLATSAGLAAVGVSLLLLEALSGGDRR